jgi:hypothetical protein
LIVIPGIVSAAVFGAHFGLADYAALQVAYKQFAQVAHGGSVAQIVAADAVQNIHRINLFADGVWALLSAIYAAIGLHGLCVPAMGSRKHD